MEEFQINSKENIITRLPRENYFVSKTLSENFDLSTVLPEMLKKVLSIYGIDLETDHLLENGYKACPWRKICLKIKLFIAHIPLLLITVMHFMDQHVTFLVSGTLDSLCYLSSLYIFLYRKKDIIQCLQEMSAIPCRAYKGMRRCKLEKTTVLLIAVFIYTIVYLTCDLLITFLYLEEPSKTNKNLNQIYLKLFANATYSLVICIGIPIHLVLFVQFASLISDRLIFVNQELESQFGNECFSPDAISKQRQVFSKLHNISSKTDSIFKDIIFLWLMKIIIRGCLSAVDIFSRSWTNEESYTQIIVIFDTIFDLFHLLTLSMYAGRIDYAKMKLIQVLIHIGSRHEINNQLRNEMHLFISMVGHSQLGFSVADMFFLNKSTALTILGALGSYCVLIYQFTSN